MSRINIVALAVVLVVQAPMFADEPGALPSDLAAVPADASGFLHVRVADMWNSALFKDLRTTILQAGPKALQAFDERFVPAPSSIDRITLVLLAPPDGPRHVPPLFVFILACSKPFDRAAALKSILPQGVERAEGGNSYFDDQQMGFAVRVVDDHTLALGPSGAMKQFVAAKANGPSMLTNALRDASKRMLSFVVKSSVFTELDREEIPPALRPMLAAQFMQFSLDANTRIEAGLRLTFADENHAASGEAAAREGLGMAKKALEGFRTELQAKLTKPEYKGVWPITEMPNAALAVAGIGALNSADEWLRDLPLKREGVSVTASASLPVEPVAMLVRTYGIAAFSLVGVFQPVR